MAKSVTTEAAAIAVSKKVMTILNLMTRQDGATSVEIQKATGENKRRSHYSLSRLAERLGYEYAAFNYTFEDGKPDLLHHFMLVRSSNGGGKRAVASTVKRAGKKSA
jgi:hypothetical protein